MKSSLVQHQIASRQTGTALQRIVLERLKEIRIPLPPTIDEQRKISSVLTSIDQAIQQTDEIIAKTQRLKHALKQELLTNGIGHKEFRETEIGSIPKEWEIRKLGEVCKIMMGQSPDGSSYNKQGTGVPLLNGPTEFGEYSPTTYQWTASPTKLCTDGDLLLCVRGNTTGRMNVADRVYCIGRGLAAISAQQEKIDSEYLKQTIEKLSEEILRMASGGGSTFPNINRDKLAGILIPLPAIREQEKISSILSSANQQVRTTKQSLESLKRIRQGFMDLLLTGKVRIQADDN